jgi:predicted nucleic acid-binding protein
VIVARVAVLDTNVILAALNSEDPDHGRCLTFFERREFDLVVPLLCVAEVSHLVNRDLDAETEAAFIDSLLDLQLEAPTNEDWIRIGQLVRQYADFPLGAVDASIVALAERLDTSLIATMDHRHFRAVRPLHVEAFTLLPAL